MPTLFAVLALVLSSPGSQPSPLAGCDATPVPHGWQYECKDVRARVEDLAESAVNVASHLEGLHAAAPAMIGDGAKTRRERRKLGEDDVEIRVTEARGRRAALMIAALPRKAGTRVLVCFVEGSPLCGAVMNWLATTPWRSGHAQGSKLREPPPLAIAGRAVQVPVDCKATNAPNGGGVTCPPAFFANWVSVDEAQGHRMVSEFGAPVRARLAQHGLKATQDEVRCLLAGAETKCARLLVEANGRRVAVLLWAAVRAGNEVVFASCQAPDGAAIRPPCSLVFSSP